MYKAKEVFLWYKVGDLIEVPNPTWIEKGHVEEVVVKEEEVKVLKKAPQGAIERIKDFTSDILDDGKRNYSNKKKKK